MDILEKINGVINEEEDSVAKVAAIIKGGVSLMSLRKPLEGIFPKKDIDFALSPIAHFRIKAKKGILIIVNKKYADDAEKVVGDLAIGYEGKI